MQFRNTPTRYGAVTKTFHWVMALLVLFMLALGRWLDGAEGLDLTLRLQRTNLHKSLGVLVLALAALRLCWHFCSRKPSAMAGHRAWERGTARATHALLYASVLAMPLTGWTMSSALGRPVSFFGLFTLPDLVPKNNVLGYRLRETHGVVSWVLVALVCLHVAGALKHHFIDRDATLRRMLPFSKTE